MSSIVPNFKNPYKCREEDMKPLEDSIRENGIIQPLMVRKDDKADVYEIISGHRRYLAATRLKLTEVPVVVLDITKEEADIILVDSNLYREHILPSEKAFAYKMKMDAIKRQGNLLSANTNSTEEEMDILFDCSQEESRILLESMKAIKQVLRGYNITK
nr:MAG TPA: chromosome partitioning protein [Caudoviricetes sp.]